MVEKIAFAIISFFGKILYSIKWFLVFLKNENAKNYVPYVERKRPLRILSNGPSLNAELEQIKDTFDDFDYCLINFSYKTPLFKQIRPQVHVLADPIFFSGDYLPEMISYFQAVDWDMTLFVPYFFCKDKDVINNPHVHVTPFHKGEYKGFENIKMMLFKKGLSMPRPENVVAAAIFNAINMGYQKIELYGVDHSWLSTLVINDDNEICVRDVHYYDQKVAVLKPSPRKSNGEKRMLYEALTSQAICFETYCKLRKYADYRGVEVLNMTKGSYIDAFERGYKH